MDSVKVGRKIRIMIAAVIAALLGVGICSVFASVNSDRAVHADVEYKPVTQWTDFVYADEDGNASAVPFRLGWTYGGVFESGEVAADSIVAGRLPVYTGGGTVTKFSLLKGENVTTDVFVSNADISLFPEYVNTSMPAGTYTLILHVVPDDGGSGNNISRAFHVLQRSEVGYGGERYFTLANNFVSAINKKTYKQQRLGGEEFAFLHDIADGADDSAEKIAYNELFIDYRSGVLETDANEYGAVVRRGAWADPKYDSYYTVELQVARYHGRKGSGTNLTYDREEDYRAITADDKFAGDDFLGTQLIAYYIRTNNYEDPLSYVTSSNISSGMVSRIANYYTVKAYRSYKKPALEVQEWEGENISLRQRFETQLKILKAASGDPGYADYSEYTVNWHEPDDGTEDYTKVGDHTVSLTLIDEYSVWDDAELKFERAPKIADITATVAATHNSWSVAPQISSWSFNGFDASVNTLASGLRFPEVGSSVKFRLGLQSSDKNYENTVWEDFAFTVDSSGVISGGESYADGLDSTNRTMSKAAVTERLSRLKPGSYYLKSRVDDILKDGVVYVKGGEFVAETADNVKVPTVFVAKATNRWEITPNIVRWTWGEYNRARNTITSSAIYPAALGEYFGGLEGFTAPLAEYQIKRLVYTADDGSAYTLENIPGLSANTAGGTSSEIWFTEINDDISAALAALDAGDYMLLTRLGGTDYYSDIPVQRTVFDIAPATNIWTSTPNIVAWTWGSYDKDVNSITAEAKYDSAVAGDAATAHDIVYAILDGAKRQIAEVEGFTDTVVQKLAGFTLTDGMPDDDIIAMLGKLDAGEYYLTAAKQGNSNYSDIEDTYIPFKVSMAENGWTDTPGLTSWQYKNFNDKNFLAGTPVFNAENNKIVYTVLDGSTEIAEFTFEVSADGDYVFTDVTVSEGESGADIVDVFNKLHVKTNYTLKANLAGNSNYKPLLYTTNFSVLKAVNTWSKPPVMTSWTYKGFTVSGNFTAGVPALAESKGDDGNAAAVVYSVVQTKDGTGNAVADPIKIEFTDIADAETALSALPVGTYAFTATYAASPDYNELKRDDVIFNVNPAANTWAPAPNITGWAYKNFTAEHFTAGGVTYTDDADAQITYTVKRYAGMNGNTLDTEFTALVFTELSSDVELKLLGLHAGRYVLEASYPKTDNYPALDTEVRFTVSQATNAWLSGKTPNMDSWVYGEFGDSLFTEGVAAHGTVLYTVRKVDGSGNITSDEIIVNGTKLTECEYAALKALLGDLDAGNYNLLAEVKAEDDYAAVSENRRFAVAAADNAWTNDRVPYINGWVYGDVPAYEQGYITVDGVKTPVSAAVDTGAIVYEYYKAVSVNGEWIKADNTEMGTPSSTTPAGHYIMTVTVPGNGNYNPLSHTVHYEVTRRVNSWTEGKEPEDRLDWSWGDTDSLASSAIVNAAADDSSNGITFIIVDTANNTSVGGGDISEILDALKGLAVGMYRVTVTVAQTDNYERLYKSTSVTVTEAEFTVNTDPSCAVWTWGDVTTGKFTDVDVTPVLESDVPIFGYTIGTVASDGSVSWSADSYGSFEGMFGVLELKDVGKYKVAITVKCDNYIGLEFTVDVNIDKADFTWTSGKTPVDTDWVWKDGTADGKLVEPEATDVKGNPVVFSYSVEYKITTDDGEQTITAHYDAYDGEGGLKEFLIGAGVNVYTVTVSPVAADPETYKLINYNDFATAFAVEVKKASNAWKVVPNESYTKEFEEELSIAQPSADHGVAEFLTADDKPLTDGDGNDITNAAELSAWLTLLAAKKDPYIFKTVVKETANYAGLTRVTRVTVTGKGSSWVNTDALAALDVADGSTDNAGTVQKTFADGLFDSLTLDTLAIPQGRTLGTTDYTLSYADYNAEVKDTNELKSADAQAVLAWIKSIAKAGKYKVTAVYTPGDPSYSTLEYEFCLDVARARPVWSVKPSETSGEYKNVPFANAPAVSGYAAAIKTEITDDAGNVMDVEGDTLAEKINNLDAVDTYYILKFGVIGTENYEGLSEESVRIYVRKVINSWNNTVIGDQTIVWKEGYSWTFTRGETVSVTVPSAVIGNDKLKIILDGRGTDYTADNINTELNKVTLEAGTHTLRFYIEESVNYNELISDCRITVNKIANPWDPGLSDYNGHGALPLGADGEIDETKFAIPDAKYRVIDGVDLLRFNIVKVGGGYAKSERTIDDFMNDLKELANGVYTITARIGGQYTVSESEAGKKLEAALAKYGMDYETITSVCTVTLTPEENGWKTSLTDKSLTWGEAFTDIEMPEADFGNDRIVYSIKGTDASGAAVEAKIQAKDFNTTDEGVTPAEQAFAKFIEFVNGLNAGDYTVTVVIDDTDIYKTPGTISVRYNVLRVVTAWKNYTEQELLVDYSKLSATWGTVDDSVFPNLAIAGNIGSVKYYINGVELADDPDTPSKNEGTWAYAFANDYGTTGKYTIKAVFIAPDMNYTALEYNATFEITKMVTVWTAATENNNGKSYSWKYSKYSEAAVKPVAPVLGVADAEGWDNSITYTLNDGTSVQTFSAWDGDDSLMGALTAKPQGNYTVKAEVRGDANHTDAVFTVYVTVSADDNYWTSAPADNASFAWTYKADDNAEITFAAYKNGDSAVITVNNKKADGVTLETLNAHLATQPVGEYVINVEIPATTQYAGLNKTVTLVIGKITNEWKQELAVNESWDWNDLTVATGGWADEIGFVAPTPACGDKALITVTPEGAGKTPLEATVSYTQSADGALVANDNDVDAFVRRLYALGAGRYTVSVTLTAGDYYTGLTSETKNFEIRKANNVWTDLPSVGYNSFGDTVYPTATPKFGNKKEVEFSYAKAVIAADGETTVPYDELTETQVAALVWSEAYSADSGLRPDEIGAYYVKARLAGGTDYNELFGYTQFTLGAAANDWSQTPSVTPWAWNNYNKEVNLFNATARYGGVITFKFTKKGTSDYVRLEKSDFIGVNGKPLVFDAALTATLDKLNNGFGYDYTEAGGVKTYLKTLPADVANLLNFLRPDETAYRLDVTASGNVNYDELSTTLGVTVSSAANAWKAGDNSIAAPRIVSFVFDTAESEIAFTAGEAEYGLNNVHYAVKKNGVAVDGASDITDVEALKTALHGLPAATYTLCAWVDGGDCYNALYSAASPYTTTFEVTKRANSWLTNDPEDNNSLGEYYAVLHASGTDAEANFKTLFAEPTVNGGAKITYSLRNTDMTGIKDCDTYAEFITALAAMGAGDYIAVVTAEECENYTALKATVIVAIKRYTSKFTALPEKLTGTWRAGADNKNDTVLDDATVTAIAMDDGGATVNADLPVKFTLDGVSYSSFDALKIGAKALPAGGYTVGVEIEETNEYGGAFEALHCGIAPTDNAWRNEWDIKNSMAVVGASARETDELTWLWNSEVEWTAARPVYGHLVYVDIRKQGSASSLRYITVDYDGEDGGVSAIGSVSSALGALDFGTYVLTVSSPADTNWNAISSNVTFSVQTAPNSWDTDGAPKFTCNVQGGLEYDSASGKYKWTYGTPVSDYAKAVHGEVEIEYYKKGSNVKLDGMPVDFGEYRAVFKALMPASKNYAAVDAEELEFEIKRLKKEVFIVSPNAMGWVWDGYTRTVNLITGIPESNGSVSFAVLDSTGAVVIDNILLGDLSGTHHGDFDKDIYVTQEVADKLNALTEGSYTLRVNVAAEGNYAEFTATTTFKVTAAVNTWTEAPKIVWWYLGLFDAKANLPKAESKYGSPVITITSDSSGATLYHAVFDRESGTYDISINDLEAAEAGWYTMIVSVDAQPGKYNAKEGSEYSLYEQIALQVGIEGSPDAKNFWQITPGIEDWEATASGNYVVLPTGKPVRGKPYFVFYREEIVNGETKLVLVTQGEDAVTIPKGDTYFKDFYIPSAPGTYYMYSYAENLATANDKLDETNSSRIKFTIKDRPIAWTQELRFSSLLYLGAEAQATWRAPTAQASAEGETVTPTFKYFDANGEYVGTEIPVEPGKYKVVAYASTRYTAEIESSMDFEVRLSKNYWTDDKSPTIENWSEEFSDKAPDPVGGAAYGTVVYTYKNLADPSITYTQKPKAEGKYMLIATVELEGYEKLEATYEFRVEAAFDMTLVIINIVLGLVACAFAAVVIVFAVRRYKEN